MKKIYGISFIVCCLLISYCAKPALELSAEEVQALLQKINQSPLGVTIRVDDSAIKTGPLEGHPGTVLITLTQPDFSVSTRILKHVYPEVPEFEVPLGMEELSWTYHPSKERLGIHSAKNVNFEFDVSQFIQLGETPAEDRVPALKFSYQLESISFDNYDMSPLLHTEGQSFIQVLTDLVESNQMTSVSLDGFTLEFDAQDGKNRMKWAVEHAEKRGTIAPEILAVFFGKAEDGSTLSLLLEEGKNLLEIGSEVRNCRVSFSDFVGDVEIDLDTFGVSYAVKPEEDRETFHLSFGWDVENLGVTGARHKLWQTLMDINRMNLQFDLGRLSSDFITAYFDLIRTTQSLRTSRDPARQQEIAMQGLALLGKFMKTKPVISFSLSPLDHALGAMEAEGEFQFLQMGPPAGKATVRISHIQELEDKLRAGGVFPPEKMDMFMFKVREMFVVDETGRGTLTFEIKEGDSAHFYLNGVPKTFQPKKSR